MAAPGSIGGGRRRAPRPPVIATSFRLVKGRLMPA